MKTLYITGGNKPIVGEGEYSAEAIAALVKAYAISVQKLKKTHLRALQKQKQLEPQQKQKVPLPKGSTSWSNLGRNRGIVIPL